MDRKLCQCTKSHYDPGLGRIDYFHCFQSASLTIVNHIGEEKRACVFCYQKHLEEFLVPSWQYVRSLGEWLDREEPALTEYVG